MQDDSKKDFYNQNSDNPFVAASEMTAPPSKEPVEQVEEVVAEEEVVEESTPARTEKTRKTPAQKEAPSEIVWSIQEKYGRKLSTTWFVVWIVSLAVLLAAALVLHLVFSYWQFWTTFALGLIIFISLLILNRQGPRVTDYTLNENQLTIEKRSFPLNSFRAFRLKQNNDQLIIELIPVKRFSTEVPMSIPEDKAEAIINLLSNRLTRETGEISIIENWLHKIGL